MLCLAPGCPDEGAGKFDVLCKSHNDLCIKTMADYRDRLLWAMPDARTEVDAWMKSEWEPAIAWSLTEEDHVPSDVDGVAQDIAERIVGQFSDYKLAFGGQKETKNLWSVPEYRPTVEAWQKHVAPLLGAAISEALRTFPVRHAGKEIVAAILRDGYDEHAEEGAYEDMRRFSPLSDDARFYVYLRYDHDPSWLFDTDGVDEQWIKFRILPEAVQLILEAVYEYEHSPSDTQS